MIRWYNVNSRNRISYWFYIIKKKICISLHYNGSNSFLFVYATKVYQFKVKKNRNKRLCTVFRQCFKRFIINSTINNTKKKQD